MTAKRIWDFLPYAQTILDKIPVRPITDLSDLIFSAFERKHKIFIIGNGGSGANASHFAEDLGKCTLNMKQLDNEKQPRLKVISLTDNTAYILAWANDEGFDRVFVEQLKNLAEGGDVLIAISGSGNSPNIIKAVEWANANGLDTFGCTGFDGGKLLKTAKKCFHVNCDHMGLVETIHLLAFHWVVDDLKDRIAASW